MYRRLLLVAVLSLLTAACVPYGGSSYYRTEVYSADRYGYPGYYQPTYPYSSGYYVVRQPHYYSPPPRYYRPPPRYYRPPPPRYYQQAPGYYHQAPNNYHPTPGQHFQPPGQGNNRYQQGPSPSRDDGRRDGRYGQSGRNWHR